MKSAASSVAAVLAEPADHLDAERQPAGSARPGTLTHGVPIRVHSRLKVEEPVEPRPFGAAPGADGDRITSMSAITSDSARARLARGAAGIVIGVGADGKALLDQLQHALGELVPVALVFGGERARRLVGLDGGVRPERARPAPASA